MSETNIEIEPDCDDSQVTLVFDRAQMQPFIEASTRTDDPDDTSPTLKSIVFTGEIKVRGHSEEAPDITVIAASDLVGESVRQQIQGLME